MLKKIALVTVVAALSAQNVYAGTAEAQKWINNEFQPSSLSKSEQMKEMEWFINAAKPFKGMEINVLSEGHPLPGFLSSWHYIDVVIGVFCSAHTIVHL